MTKITRLRYFEPIEFLSKAVIIKPYSTLRFLNFKKFYKKSAEGKDILDYHFQD